MERRKAFGAVVGLFLMLAAVVVLAGCGGGGGSSSSSEEATTSEESSGEEAGSGSKETASAGSEGGVDMAKVEEILAPYEGQYYPEFPVEEALAEKPDPNTQIGSLQESSAIGGLLVEIMEGAAKTAGVQFSVVKAGSTASTAQAAAETVVSKDPDAFYLPPFEPSTISKQLGEMHEKEIPVVITGGSAESAEYPAIVANLVPPEQFESYGRIMAAWALSKHGAETDAVLVNHPELSFAKALDDSFTAAMKELCPECGSEILNITQEEISQAPNKIVSTLQAHPDINQIVGISDFIPGLPAAEKAAGLNVGIFAYPGEPTTFEYIKNGEIEGALAEGLGTQSFTVMDILLREVQGQELTPAEKKGWQPMQILQQKDITFDPKFGWEPKADYAEVFAKYWHAEE